VTAYGPGLSHGVVNVPAEFTIVTKDAGAGTAGMFWVFLLLPFPTKYINHFDKLDSDLTD